MTGSQGIELLARDRMERTLLHLLLENGEPFWWGIEEVMHVSGNPVLALDALAGLVRPA